MERRLTAILAADVVGYSRFMELDEGGRLAALRTLRTELIDPLAPYTTLITSPTTSATVTGLLNVMCTILYKGCRT